MTETKYCKKVGIMGGTFDPIHYGHLLIAQTAAETYDLDEVLFVPSGTPWLKDTSKVLNKKTRVSMTGLAIEDNPKFALSTIEIDREGNSYSYETLEMLILQNPDTEYYFIMGADSLLEIERWKNPDKLMTSCTLLVAIRNACDMSGLEKQAIYLGEKYNASICYLETPRLDISSTDIRRRAADGKSIRYMLPEQIENYIIKNRIYEKDV